MTDPSKDMMKYFGFSHLPEHLQPVSEQCHDLALWMVNNLPSSPEKTMGVRKLLEAKDCFVRANL